MPWYFKWYDLIEYGIHKTQLIFCEVEYCLEAVPAGGMRWVIRFPLIKTELNKREFIKSYFLDY